MGVNASERGAFSDPFLTREGCRTVCSSICRMTAVGLVVGLRHFYGEEVVGESTRRLRVDS
jgi:hypothetical protein